MAQRYDLVTPREGKDGKTYWTKVGVAFPSKDGVGFSLSLEAYPLPNKEGEVRMIMRPPMERDGQRNGGEQRGRQIVESGRQPARPIDDDDSIPF